MNVRTILLPALICAVATLSAQDSQAKAKSLVKEAIALALLKETNNATGRFHVKSGDDLYLLVYDMTGTCVGNGFQPQMIGVNRITYKDPNGVLVVQEFIKIAQTKGSGWVDYHYANPKTGKQDAKTTYVEKFGDVLVACGVYK
jgi:cytochrome c